MKAQNVWIFQANLEHFALDDYLLAHSETTWAIQQKHYAPIIQIGDLVYIWGAQGVSKAPAGIVATAIITHLPLEMPEDIVALSYWKGSDKSEVTLRCRLSVIEYAQNKKQVIKREWLKEDPVLSNLSILSMAQQTNYLIESKVHRDRLADLWANTGRDWSEKESLAGLWAYSKTYGNTVSRLKGSIIVDIALKIGRPVGGVYNKVMNFRALDPRDERSGLSRGSVTDEAVWEKYYEPKTQTIKEEEVEQAFICFLGNQASDLSEVPVSPIPLERIQADLNSKLHFDLQDIQDTRQKTLTAIALRQGQRRFRQTLLKLYDNQCLITGCRIPEVLEAAHIYPYQGETTNHPANGLLLRADIHTLFDLGLVSIDPTSLTVAISDKLMNTEYASLQGKSLFTVAQPGIRPSTEALQRHFEDIFVSGKPTDALLV